MPNVPRNAFQEYKEKHLPGARFWDHVRSLNLKRIQCKLILGMIGRYCREASLGSTTYASKCVSLWKRSVDMGLSKKQVPRPSQVHVPSEAVRHPPLDCHY